MKNQNIHNIGSRVALFIGLPFGTIFSLTVFVFSLFPMLDFGIVIIGGQLFWHPIICVGLIPVTFIFLLWAAGRKIKTHLGKNYSVIKTSFLFTVFVNNRLFGLIILIFIVSGFLYNPLQTNPFDISLIAIGLTVLTYIIATTLTTLTIGLLIVFVTKNKIDENCRNSSFNRT